jgi:hypothetical protein
MSKGLRPGIPSMKEDNPYYEIIVGPWVGEFGWELFCWQAYARTATRHYNKVTVICKPGHEELYKDFATDFKYFDTPAHGHADMSYHTGLLDRNYIGGVKYEYPADIDVLPTQCIPFTPDKASQAYQSQTILWYEKGRTLSEFKLGPTYHKYGQVKVDNYGPNILLHARNRSGHRSGDNWSMEKWNELAEELVKRGHTVGWIGSQEEALALDQGIDCRGITLENLTTMMGNAQVLLSPSSGPVHLAALCNLPHVVWTIESNRLRNEKIWNPFQTPLKFLSEYEWDPTVDHVLQNTLELIYEQNNSNYRAAQI